MSPRPRRLAGVVFGLVWGIGTALLVAMYGLRPLDPLTLYGIPAAAAVLSGLWSKRGGRATAAALVVLTLPSLSAPGLLAQESCEIRVDGQFLPGTSIADPVVVDRDTDPVAVEVSGPDDAGEAAAWVRIGGIRVEIASGSLDGGGYWEFGRSSLHWFDAPGLYEVGGSVAGHCSESGYVHVEGNPLAHPLGQGAAAAVAVGLLGTLFTGRAPSGGHSQPEPSRADPVRSEGGEPESTSEPTEAEHTEPEQAEPEAEVDAEPDAEAEPEAEPEHTQTPMALAAAMMPRTMEAALFDQATGQALAAFAAGAGHRIEVRIGQATAAWADAAGLTDAEPRRIQVILTEPDLLPQPQVAYVDLAGSGASSLATFNLQTNPDTTGVNARLIALRENRILHTARLPSVSVPASPGAPPSDVPRDVARLETVAAASTTSGDQRRIDAALLVNHSGDGTPRLTGVADEAAAVLNVGEGSIAAAVAGIDRELGQVVATPGDFGDLGSPGSVEVLIVLANHGRLLRSHIVDDFLDDRLASARSIQVVSATPDAYFPLELAYDFPAPLEKAALCPGAKDTLASPDPTSECEGHHDETIVCPLGFWGLSRVIERHAHNKGDQITGRFLLRSAPVLGRDLLAPGDVLFAASDRVDGFAPGSVDAVADTLARLSYGHTTQAKKWDEWIVDVAERPALMMLLPHTVYSDTLHLPGLEIGTADRRWSSHFDQRFVPPDDRPVIAVILGCATAIAGDVTYEAFPAAFRRAGVEVVIGTLTQILGRHAAPIASSLAEQIFDAWRTDPAPFGEAMVGLRRRALADGLIAALAVIAFGDADWLLGRAQPRSTES